MIIYGVRWRVVFVGSALIELVRYSSLQPNPLRMEEVPWWWHALNQLIWDACYAGVSPNRSNLSSCKSDEPGEHAGVGNEGFPGCAAGVATGPGGSWKNAQLNFWLIRYKKPGHSQDAETGNSRGEPLVTRWVANHGSFWKGFSAHAACCDTDIMEAPKNIRNHVRLQWGKIMHEDVCYENVNRQDQTRSHV